MGVGCGWKVWGSIPNLAEWRKKERGGEKGRGRWKIEKTNEREEEVGFGWE
jgi:hypothetical protein